MAPVARPRGSYQQYKNDTSIFMTWVFQAAQACGYVVPITTGTTRQVSDASDLVVQHGLPVGEVLAQARVVAQSDSPRLSLPASIARLAKRAIETRRSFTTIFKSLDLGGDADAKHEHFTNILQESLMILQQFAVPITQCNTVADSDERPHVEIANRFALLEVEDIEDFDAVLHILTVEKAAKVTADAVRARRVQDAIASFKADANLVQSICMQIFCLFEDLHTLEDQVSDMWCKRRAGTIDTVAAAVGTNAAIALAEQLERELLDSLPDEATLKSLFRITSFTTKESYKSVTGILWSVTTGREEIPLQELGSKRGRYVYFDTAFSLVQYAVATARQREQGAKSLSQIAIGSTDPTAYAPFPFVRTLINVLLTYFPNMTSLETLGIGDFSALNTRDLSLKELIMSSLAMQETYERYTDSARVTTFDGFTRAMKEVKEGRVSLSAVFAANLVGVVTNVLNNDTAEYADEVRKLAAQCFEKIKYGSAQVPYDDSSLYWSNEDDQLTSLIERINSMVNDLQTAATLSTELQTLHMIHEEKLEGQSEYSPSIIKEYMDSLLVRPPSSVHHPLESNPILCGTIMFNLQLLREQVGICLANRHLTVLLVSHLYNALKQQNLLHGTWQELEQVFAFQSPDLFLGRAREKPTAIFNCYMLRLGCSVADLEKPDGKVFVAGKGGDGSQGKGKGASCMSISEFAVIGCAGFNGKLSWIRCFHDIHKLIVKNRGGRKLKGSGTLDARSYLPELVQFIMTEDERQTIDYVELTKTCASLLKALWESNLINLPAQARDPATYRSQSRKGPGDPNKSGARFVHVVKQILWEDKEWEKERAAIKTMAKKTGQGMLRHSDIALASRFCQQWLDERKLLVPDAAESAKNAQNGGQAPTAQIGSFSVYTNSDLRGTKKSASNDDAQES